MQALSLHRELKAKRTRVRTQAGYSLMDILATMLIMSTVIAALMGGLFALVISSGSHRKVVQSGLEATTIAEAVARAPYIPCGDLDAYKALISIPPAATISGLTVSLGSIQYLENGTSSEPTFTSDIADCPIKTVKPADKDVLTDAGIQQITVVVTRPKSGGTEKIAFTKRDDRCSQYKRATLPGQTC